MVSTVCVACEARKHLLYACQKFKLLPHNQMVSLLKSNDLCMNCMNAGHFVRQCPSSQRGCKCQKAPPRSPTCTSGEHIFPPEHKTQCSVVYFRNERFQSDLNCFVTCCSVWPQVPSCTTDDVTCKLLPLMALPRKQEGYLTPPPLPLSYLSIWLSA